MPAPKSIKDKVQQYTDALTTYTDGFSDGKVRQPCPNLLEMTSILYEDNKDFTDKQKDYYLELLQLAYSVADQQKKEGNYVPITTKKSSLAPLSFLPSKSSTLADPAIVVERNKTLLSGLNSAHHRLQDGVGAVGRGLDTGLGALAVAGGAIGSARIAAGNAVTSVVSSAVKAIEDSVRNISLADARKAISDAIDAANDTLTQAKDALDAILADSTLSDAIKAHARQAFGATRAAAEAAIQQAEAAGKKLQEIGTQAAQEVGKLADSTKEAVTAAVTTAKESIIEINKTVHATIDSIATSVHTNVDKVKQNIIGNIGLPLQAIVVQAIDRLKTVDINQIRDTLKDIIKNIKQDLEAAKERLEKILQDSNLSDAIKEAAKKAYEKAIQEATAAMDAAQKIADKAGAKADDIIEAFEHAATKVTEIADAAENKIVELADKANQRVSAAATAALENVKAAGEKLSEMATTAVNATRAVGSFAKGMLHLGQRGLTAVATTIKDTVLALVGAAVLLAKKIPAVAKDLWNLMGKAVNGLSKAYEAFTKKANKIIGIRKPKEDKDAIYRKRHFDLKNCRKYFDAVIAKDSDLSATSTDHLRSDGAISITLKDKNGKNLTIPIMTINKEKINFPKLEQNPYIIRIIPLKELELFAAAQKKLVQATIKGLDNIPRAKGIRLDGFDETRFIKPAMEALKDKDLHSRTPVTLGDTSLQDQEVKSFLEQRNKKVEAKREHKPIDQDEILSSSAHLRSKNA
ncbi:MAG: hypothetical protein ABSA84_07725 [Gammaproteobacteria bacterium]